MKFSLRHYIAGLSLLLFSQTPMSAQIFSWISEWGTDFGASYSHDLALDSDKNSYVVGSLYGDARFGPSQLTQGGFLVKYNALGNELWGLSLSNITLKKVVVDEPHGSLYVVGDSSGAVYVARYDMNGRSQWTYTYTENYAEGWSLSVDGEGNLYVAGMVEQLAYISKLTADGVKLWGKQFSWNLPEDEINSWESLQSALDSEGNLYVAAVMGWLNHDVMLVKLNGNGHILWEKVVAGNATPEGLVYDGKGGIVMGLSFFHRVEIGTASFDAGSPTSPNGLVARFDTGGTFIRAVLLSSPQELLLEDVALGMNGSILVTGHADADVTVGDVSVSLARRRGIIGVFDADLTPDRLFGMDALFEAYAIAGIRNSPDAYITGRTGIKVIVAKVEDIVASVDDRAARHVLPATIIPNPIADAARLICPLQKIDRVQIHSVDGRMMRGYDGSMFKGGEGEISFEGLPSGVYYVHLQGPEGTSVVKALKQ